MGYVGFCRWEFIIELLPGVVQSQAMDASTFEVFDMQCNCNVIPSPYMKYHPNEAKRFTGSNWICS